LLLDRQNAFNFRVSQYKGGPHLSYVLKKKPGSVDAKEDRGYILDSSYQVVRRVGANDGTRSINMHEFNIIPGEDHALVMTVQTQRANDSTLNVGDDRNVNAYGFQEVDIDNSKTLFKWSSLDHVPVSDSYIEHPHGAEFDFL
jgi:hypothetical protein